MQHPNHIAIIQQLKALKGRTNPWLIAIHEFLPDEKMHLMLVEQLASQAADDKRTMTKIVGLEITELLLNKKLMVV